MSVLNKELDVCRIQKHQAFQKRFLPLAESAVENIQRKLKNKNNIKITVSNHGNVREYQRCVSNREILQVIEEGYPIEYQGHNYEEIHILMMGYVKINKKQYRPLHVSIIYNRVENRVHVKTVYDPRSREWQWNETFEQRMFFIS